MKYQQPRAIFVDVDNTLVAAGVLNTRLVARLKQARQNGYKLVLWSSRGEQYARRQACRFSVIDLFTHVIDKPAAIIDDQGLNWLQYVKINPGAPCSKSK
jgi:predicted HAD superfamily phosphohydrolase YqeG